MSEQLKLTCSELIALAHWHTDPERDREPVPTDSYLGHVERAAELLRMAEKVTP